MMAKKKEPTPQELAIEAAKEAVNKMYEKLEAEGRDPADLRTYNIADIVERARLERTLWDARSAKREANKKGD